MVEFVCFLFLFHFMVITWGVSREQTCNLTCVASHSYCDEDNICRCEPEYPIYIELHSCRKEKKYNEECDYSEECYYYDKGSYCSKLPYKSICQCYSDFHYSEQEKRCIQGKKYNEDCDYSEECYYYDKGKRYNEKCDYTEECNHYDKSLNCYKSTCQCGNEFRYSEHKNICVKIFGAYPKTSYLVSPTAFIVFCTLALIICGGFLLWYVFRRSNGANATFARNGRTSQYFSSDSGSQNFFYVPTAPTFEEALPTQNFNSTEFSSSRTSHYNLTLGQSHQISVDVPSAPTFEEPLPTYNTVLSLKETEACGSPPSYTEVFSKESKF